VRKQTANTELEDKIADMTHQKDLQSMELKWAMFNLKECSKKIESTTRATMQEQIDDQSSGGALTISYFSIPPKCRLEDRRKKAAAMYNPSALDQALAKQSGGGFMVDNQYGHIPIHQCDNIFTRDDAEILARPSRKARFGLGASSSRSKRKLAELGFHQRRKVSSTSKGKHLSK
jgi:hypothetical protein